MKEEIAFWYAASADFGTCYSRCPECNALVPLDSELIDTMGSMFGRVMLSRVAMSELLFACECGANWSIMLRGER